MTLGRVLSQKTYTAALVNCHDGDTITVDVPLARVARMDQYLGFGCRVEGRHIVARAHVRLYGINAPEVPSPEGFAARDYLRGLFTTGRVLVRAWQAGGHDITEKYGRLLADVWADTLDGASVNEQMISTGNAVSYFGGPR